MTNDAITKWQSSIRQLRDKIDVAAAKRELFEREGPGYVLLNCFEILSAVRSDNRVLESLSSVLGQISTPITVFLREGRWKKIPVNPDVLAHRVTGTGLIPLHIDCVNTEQPPDLVAFFCEHDDDDGGMSLITRFAELKGEFSTVDLRTLTEIRIKEGKFYELAHVGKELNPFPILQLIEDKVLWVRHTGKILREKNALSDEAAHWVKRIDDALMHRATRVAVTAGQLLIVNQHLCAHGRLPLRVASGRAAGSERVLWQCFFRSPINYVTKCLLKPADISSR